MPSKEREMGKRKEEKKSTVAHAERKGRRLVLTGAWRVLEFR